MMKHLAIFLLLLLPLQALADAAGDMHTQSAFLFARRKMWGEAIAHAKASHNKVLVKYFTWEYLKDPEGDARFEDIVAFVNENPDWPDQAQLERRAEVALMAENPSDETLEAWFKQHPPQTNFVKIKTAKDPEVLRALIREAWVSDDYDAATEAKLLEKYQAILRPSDHARRIDRLLWEGKEDAAKRILTYAPYSYQQLFQTRMAFAEDKQRALVDLVNIPPDLRSDTGLLYENIRYHLKRDDKDGVRKLLLLAPAEVPYPEKWWPLRDKQVREAVGENNIPLAEKLLAHHGQKEGSLSYKEAQWLSGWIALEFRNQPEKAYTLFSELYKETETPAGKSRAAYWAGRAAERSGKNFPNHWFMNAARYPTTFYGQLAAWELNKEATLHIVSDSATPGAADKARFRKKELVELVYALAQAHQSDAAGRFITYLVEKAQTPAETVLAAKLGREINRIDFSVRAAKKALQKDVISLDSGYPLIGTPATNGLEKPLVLALSRQESEFFADAVSTSGAVGLMQLLPSTAREIAKKNHMPYSADRLFNPSYNMTLGSIYLSKMVDKFSGSYVLSVASYNAGPGSVV